MVEGKETLTGYFGKLCDLHMLSKPLSAYSYQTYEGKAKTRCQLRRVMYNALFNKQRGIHSGPSIAYVPKTQESLTAFEQMLVLAYQLRCERQFDDAQRLEELIAKISDIPDVDASLIRSVFKLLLCLQQSGNGKLRPELGHKSTTYQVVRSKNYWEQRLQLKGPRMYGDTKYILMPQQGEPFQYMQYALSLFDPLPALGNDKMCPTETHMPDIQVEKVCSHLPGQNIGQFFRVEGILDDRYEKKTRHTLFGALTKSQTTKINVKMELPELDSRKIPEMKVPKYFEISDDDGFVDASTSSSSQVSPNSDDLDLDIWEAALQCDLPQHFTWERHGKRLGPIERPYLSEAGPKVLDQLYICQQRQLALLAPDFKQPSRREVSQQDFIKDILYLLIGVPSHTFAFKKDCFSMVPGTCISGTTPEGLRSLCHDFIQCATHYTHLTTFSAPCRIDSFYRAGFVFQAFTGGVHHYLQLYKACILSVDGTETTLLQLKCLLWKVMKQLRYLAELCHCCDIENRNHAEYFPTGIRLLSYLFKEASESDKSDNYIMLLSLLHTSCQPYVMFIQDWVFHGICRDLYGEFLIEVNNESLDQRDKRYWTSAFKIVTSDNWADVHVPLFLEDMTHDIFICGKTINLLRLCAPHHFLFGLEIEIPQVKLAFSEFELHEIDEKCQLYVSHVKTLAQKDLQSRQEKAEAEMRAKTELIRRAREIAASDLAKLQNRLIEMKRADEAKKRKILGELKDQMDRDLMRKAIDTEQEKEKDKEIMEELSKREILQTEYDKDLEMKAREELVEYYEKLTEEAAFREQRALWKVRRERLNEDRTSLLMKDEVYWESEMKEFQPNTTAIEDEVTEKKLDKTNLMDLSLGMTRAPSTAVDKDLKRQVALLDKTVDTSNLLNLTMPDMGTAGFSTQPMTDKGPSVMDMSISSLPTWAQTDSNKTMHVSDDTDDTQDSKPQADIVKAHPSYSSVDKLLYPGHEKSQTDDTDKIPIKINLPNLAQISKQEQVTEIEKIQPASSKTIKKTSLFGSQVVAHGDYEISAPKLRRPAEIYASLETNQTNYHIAPRLKARPDGLFSGTDGGPQKTAIKLVSDKYATKTSLWVDRDEINAYNAQVKRQTKALDLESDRPQTIGDIAQQEITLQQKQPNVSKESDFIDFEKIRSKKFKEQNVQGHSSDSSIQKLLYCQRQDKGSDVSEEVREEALPETEEEEESPEVFLSCIDTRKPAEPYRINYDVIGQLPLVADLMSSIGESPFSVVGMSAYDDISAQEYMSVSVLIKRSIASPLQAQINLVNQSIVSYFFNDLSVESHCQSLRRFFFMEDGEFGQSLSDHLFDKLSNNPSPHEMLNPVFLNKTLSNALASSLHGNTAQAKNISFAISSVPQFFSQNACDSLDCLKLRYRVEWPVNVILTESRLSKYANVFSFLLQIKRVVWVLKDIWYTLKQDGQTYSEEKCPQLRQLLLYRHEMQHFVRVMQEYIANQAIHVTWVEFQESLNKVKNLDDICHTHGNYINSVEYRCLLSVKARPIMKVIKDIFCLILKFRSLLNSSAWEQDHVTGHMIHDAYNNLVKKFKSFKEYSRFLFKVVKKLASRGYQSHLQELLLRLDFNDFYSHTNKEP